MDEVVPRFTRGGAEDIEVLVESAQDRLRDLDHDAVTAPVRLTGVQVDDAGRGRRRRALIRLRFASRRTAPLQ